MPEVAKYLFKSWARKGIAANISEPDTLGVGVPPAADRATIKLSIDLNVGALTRDFTLIGPGDIVGIHQDMVVRTEPLNWITNFEPNYLAFVEFYDEDFPFRYTPASPVGPIAGNPFGERLRPWIVLLVLKEDEFEKTEKKLPLPSIKVKKEALPKHTETYLWAHVHFDEDIAGTFSDLEKFLNSLNTKIETDPDKIYSRLMSPRRLEANKAYHAFVVPAFESGRLAGLGVPTEGVPAQKPSWDGAQDVEFPVYYQWFFRTSENQDFEELVKNLVPRVMPPEVGIRDMDVSKPGFVQVDADGIIIRDGLGKEQPVSGADPSVFGLEGAIKSPYTVSKPKAEDFLKAGTNRDFYEQLENLVNFPEKMRLVEDEDPIVSVPFYGQNHARQKKENLITLDVDNKGWYHDLNRDPRNRTSGGFGTAVIQKHQETLMQKAWVQLEKVMEANRLMRQTKAMGSIALKYTEKYFQPLKMGSFLAITSLVHSKILGSPTTIRQQVRESQLPEAVFSSAFRRLIRPNGKVTQRLNVSEVLDYQQLVTDLNEGKVTAAPPKETPSVLPTLDDVAEQTKPKIAAWLKWIIDNALGILLLLLVLLFIIAIFTGAFLICMALAAAVVGGYFYAKNIEKQFETAEILNSPEKTLEAIPNIPQRPNFNIQLDDEIAAPAPTTTSGGADSVQAQNFRTALTTFNTRLAIKMPVPAPLKPLDLGNALTKVRKAIHPHTSFSLQLSARVIMPPALNWVLQIWEQITPAMAHPDFEDPMYAPLRDMGKELLLPNIQLIPPDTISLLETNPPFIESYLVGLNHEMGRELLWREYPTDLRGSYFRQFWDVKGIIAPGAVNAAKDADDLKDITKIHTWQSFTELGGHRKGGKKEKVVLVIRGELLKKYPNTVIYAQKAITNTDAKTKALHPIIIREEPTEAQFKKEYKFPIFKAEVEPDIKFFGFELTIEEAQGTKNTEGFEGDTLGWFFVIQQIPGEPRFGMDIKYQPNEAGAKDTWDNVSWEKLPTPNAPFITTSNVPILKLTDEENKHEWGASSSEMAYILFQKPVMVAVHANEMLQKAMQK